MQANVSTNNGEARIKLAGRFDFNSHREFRAAYEPLLDNADVRTVVIDLGGVDYLDSSALGMLLMVRDKAGSANKAVTLANAQPGVKQVLDIANFGKLFKMV
ncbi:MAG: STAS domain-containing protein [Betaproteobacteria bacterium]|nr:STAS domain-containing protein [Betaproteobacteria bacterium]